MPQNSSFIAKLRVEEHLLNYRTPSVMSQNKRKSPEYPTTPKGDERIFPQKMIEVFFLLPEKNASLWAQHYEDNVSGDHSACSLSNVTPMQNFDRQKLHFLRNFNLGKKKLQEEVGSLLIQNLKSLFPR